MSRVYWLSVLYHGKEKHQFSGRPWGHPASGRRGEEQQSCPSAWVFPLLTYKGSPCKLAPGRQALSSRAGPETEEPQLPSACKKARLERRRWGTGKNARCSMEMQSLKPAVLGKFHVPSTNEMFLLQACFGGVPASTQAV